MDKEEWKGKIRTELIMGEELSTTEEEPEESEDSDADLRELAILLDFDEGDRSVGGAEEPLDSGWRDVSWGKVSIGKTSESTASAKDCR